MPDFSKWETSDLIAFVTIVILGVSLISPMIVAFVQRRTELKSKMLDIYKESYSKRYNREYYIFQDYIEKSGTIIAKLDSSQKMSDKEIQEFESASLKCLIFLSESERSEFDVFRINVKKALGIEDPREKKTFMHPDYFKELNKTIVKFSQLSNKTIIVSPIYSSFNKCINIAAQRLATIQAEEKAQLHLIQITLLEHLHRISLTILRKLASLCKSVKSKVCK
ncbi:TPA: hypothetical protein U2D59_002147 [Streptococcus suis]|uniref:Uncharacterized protein n=2 Tax=Streptococcus suis TaxID=1307 RepID=A0A0Z8NKS8_STRSU|nr:hypothetical protein [Streptococcus suis]NQG20446.1 hypothetical protein [Streptococcus suis]NQG46157.1 hypothetical protein [Streptococcus suis]NQH08003.1 hypothetical protein [Streptococcus suis]NQH16313.1 hypothetical protein [Streptococcus suis]NQK42178.1 hypothetical protein [Streptococcus suis]